MGETTTAPPAAPPTPLRRFLTACWQPETALFLGFWLILLYRGRSFFFKDQGSFWHTVTGQLILQRGNLPATDPFSFTFQGQPWMLHEWLAQIIMAFLYRIDGLSTHLVVAAGLLAGLFAWTEAQWLERTAGSALRRLGYRRWLRNLAVALGNAPRSAEAAAALRARADVEDPVVREHVRWALARQGVSAARD